jgi:hypothetical protein
MLVVNPTPLKSGTSWKGKQRTRGEHKERVEGEKRPNPLYSERDVGNLLMG